MDTHTHTVKEPKVYTKVKKETTVQRHRNTEAHVEVNLSYLSISDIAVNKTHQTAIDQLTFSKVHTTYSAQFTFLPHFLSTVKCPMSGQLLQKPCYLHTHTHTSRCVTWKYKITLLEQDVSLRKKWVYMQQKTAFSNILINYMVLEVILYHFS